MFYISINCVAFFGIPFNDILYSINLLYFSILRFDMDYDDEVVYCYEIQGSEF